MTLSNEDRQTIETINLTGFPLQLAIEKQFDSWHHAGFFRWETFKREVPWRDEMGTGFIDLILWNLAKIRVVVECKRVLPPSEWIFIRSSDESQEEHHFQLPHWITNNKNDYSLFARYADVTCSPGSAEAPMSIVRRKDGQPGESIDVECSKLIRATEALLEFDASRDHASGEFRVYFPMILTTAPLKLVTADAKKISFSDGNVVEGKVTEVPYLRYRKTLHSAIQPNLNPRSTLVDGASGVDRSVFIVNTNHLREFMKKFNNFSITHSDLFKGLE